MAGGPQPRGYLASEQYPGHRLSIIEALNAVSMKLCQVDAMRYVSRSHMPLIDSSRNKLFTKSKSHRSNGLYS